MFAFLTSKSVVGADSQTCSSVSWNKETDTLIVGRSDGLVLLRQLDLHRGSGRTSSLVNKNGGEAARGSDQDLLNHQAPVRAIAWNSKHSLVATGDLDGVTTVWRFEPKTKVWQNHMATRAVQFPVLAMDWTKNGELICIVYENGMVMVGKIDGIKLWSVEVKHARIPAWSPDGEALLVGTSLGQVFVYDKAGNNVGLVTLTSKSEERPSESQLISIRWYAPADDAKVTTRTLVIAFEDGKYFLLHGENDHQPLALRLPMSVVCVDWTSTGRNLAFGGRNRKSAAIPDETAQIIIVTPVGKQECIMRFKFKTVDGISWDSSGRRLALLLDSKLNFLTIKRPIKFCHFDNILAYVCTADDSPDAIIIFYNTKLDKKVVVKHYTGQRIHSLTAGNDFCLAATQVIKEAYQFNVYIFSDTGATVNVFFTNIEPIFAAANENQVFIASREVIFVWNFRQSGNIGSVLESSALRWESADRYFHIDDAHGVIDLKSGRQRLYEISADPICAMTASKDLLIVARESGNIVRYSLPQMRWEREYVGILPSVRKLALNSDSSRLLLLSSSSGVCMLYALAEIKLSRDSPPIKDVKIILDRKEVWDFIWAEDDPELFAITHKNRTYVYRNKDAEEPIVNDGYLCQFKDLEMRVVQLEDLIRPENLTEPTPDCLKILRVKALRETYKLMETGSLTETQRYVDTQSHPVLWNLIANRAVQKSDLDLAEICYIRGQNWKGITFVKKLQNLKDVRVQKAEIDSFFGDHYRAEQEYHDADRSDLAFELRKTAGDWFRLKEMALDSQNEEMLKEANQGIGSYFFDRQTWSEAARSYEAARDYKSLYRVYMLSGDAEKLEQLAEILPPGHFLLVDIGQLLSRYGNSVAAAKILRKADRPDLAIDASLENYDFQIASEIARISGLDSHTSDQVLAVVDSVIKAQIGDGSDIATLWNAGNLYYSSGLFLEAAKCLFKILAEEITKSANDYQRLKKIAVLAASAAQKFKSEFSGGSKVSSSFHSDTFHEELKSTEFPFLDNPWRQAEAFNLMSIAQTFYHSSAYEKGLRAAGTLCIYTDILDPTKVYSLIALSAVQLRRWDVVNEAIMKVVNLETTSSNFIKEIELFAEKLFTKYSPNDVDQEQPLPTPKCLNCQARLPIWDIRCHACGTKFPLCMATGCPIVEAQVWQCDFCHRHCSASIALHRQVCPLCHSPRA